LQNLVNNSLSLAIDFKPDILFSLKMIHLYPHTLELRPKCLYVFNTVRVVQQIEYIDLKMHKMDNLK